MINEKHLSIKKNNVMINIGFIIKIYLIYIIINKKSLFFIDKD